VTRSAWPLARARGVDLGLEVPATPLAARGHAGLLQEALSNLVHNAILYTPAGGSVTVDVVCVNGWACLSVRDDGPGIPAHDRARVGERFLRVQRESNATTAPPVAEPAPGGSGLGLAIAHAIALRHGGQLELTAASDDALRPGLLARLRWPDRKMATL